MLSVIFMIFKCIILNIVYSECHYAESDNATCHIILRVVIISGIILSVIILSVVILSVVMLSVVILSVVIISVAHASDFLL